MCGFVINNNEVVYFKSRKGWNNIFSITHTLMIQFLITIFWVHIVVRHFMEPFWIWGCQITSKERALLLSDTHICRPFLVSAL